MPDSAEQTGADESGEQTLLPIDAFLECYRRYAENLSQRQYPHQNRWVALAHHLADAVALISAKRMKAGKHPVACRSGCDACCYFADVSATRIEFEEACAFLRIPENRGFHTLLSGQFTEHGEGIKNGFRPCPFLNRSSGNCAVYPVRPLGCRLLLSWRVCGLDDEVEGEFEACARWTRQTWSAMPVNAGALLAAVEHQRAGELYFRLDQVPPESRIDFKALTSETFSPSRGMNKSPFQHNE